ncbi:hypothetical protein C3L33_03462, partial [Rhododendron williamsianum]
MASRSSDPEQPSLSSLGKVGKSSGEIEMLKCLLLMGNAITIATLFSQLSSHSRHFRFLFPALGGLLYGYDIGATSCATISVESATSSGTTWYDLSSVDIGLILLMLPTSRRRELIVASVLYLVGALVTALAPDLVVMVIGRFVFGIGIGLSMHAAPMYIAETAPSQIRGQLISLKEFFIVLGMVAGYTLGSLLVDTVSGWRYMYGASTPIAIDLRETAICCLCRLRGEAIGDSAPEQVEEMLGELSYVGEEKEAGLAEMFQGKCLKALIIGGGLVLFQQITGQPSVLYYAASILESAGFSAASDATRVSILLGLLKLIMTGVAVVVVDRVGRRPLLLGGVSVMVISLFLLGSYYTFLDNAPVMAVVALLLYVGCYQFTFRRDSYGSCVRSSLRLFSGFPSVRNMGFLSIVIWSHWLADDFGDFPASAEGSRIKYSRAYKFRCKRYSDILIFSSEGIAGIWTFVFHLRRIAIISLAFIYFIVPETKGSLQCCLKIEKFPSRLSLSSADSCFLLGPEKSLPLSAFMLSNGEMGL